MFVTARIYMYTLTRRNFNLLSVKIVSANRLSVNIIPLERLVEGFAGIEMKNSLNGEPDLYFSYAQKIEVCQHPLKTRTSRYDSSLY